MVDNEENSNKRFVFVIIVKSNENQLETVWKCSCKVFLFNISSLGMMTFRSCGQIQPNQTVISSRDSSNKIVTYEVLLL